MRPSSQKRYVLWKKKVTTFGYHFVLCNRYFVFVLMKKNDKILTHFGDANLKK